MNPNTIPRFVPRLPGWFRPGHGTLILVLASLVLARGEGAVWTNGIPTDPGFFPIAVWLQPPSRAKAYRDAGFNLYVGLWSGPTATQLAALKQAGMRVICDQNDLGLAHRDDPTIVGWMHGDEPDNAQSLGEGKGYGPPILPARIVADYEKLRERDPTRPVLLNLGQGVAWDDWHGRGVRTRHPEDYAEYVKGADLLSFDIYPVTHDRPAVSSNLWFVARGVERLVEWTGGRKPVWNCIECTRISHPTAKPTPHQVRAEVWMALIHGSRGLIYFVHEWKPRFNESALLGDPELLPAVTRINRQIQELAPVLNSPTVPDLVRVRVEDPEKPVAVMSKRHGDSVYVFAVAMRDRDVKPRFEVAGTVGGTQVEVLGEDRFLQLDASGFEDRFAGYAVHLYRVPGR
jgi:hypothetical protein